MKKPGLAVLALLVCLCGAVTGAQAQIVAVAVTDPSQVPSQKGHLSSGPLTNSQIGPNTFVQDPSFNTIKAAPPGYQLGNSTQDIFVFCVNLFTGEILSFCNVQLTTTRQFGSGGHQHGDPGGHDQPIAIGSFNPAQGVTGDATIGQGFLKTTFTASEASGTANVLITGTLQDGTPVLPGQLFMLTQIHDTQSALAGAPGFTVDSSSSGHDNNNVWLTQSTIDDFVNGIANFQDVVNELFDGRVTAATVPVTATTLPQGGVFDYQNHDWKPAHVSHRYGRDLDVGTWTRAGVAIIPTDQRASLAQALEAEGFTMPVPTESFDTCTNPPCDLVSRHWHLRDGY